MGIYQFLCSWKKSLLSWVMAILIKILSRLRQPEVWVPVRFVASVVGLVCYALSSSFNDLFGKWSWWKILLYILFSFIVVSLPVLFTRERSSSSRIEPHRTFCVLLITSIYSFFYDKKVKGKPDAYSLFAFAAFAIMSLGLSIISHFEFGIDLLCSFGGGLIIQTLKVELIWSVVVGGSFVYGLLLLCSTLDPRPRSGYLGHQDRDNVDIETDSRSHREVCLDDRLPNSSSGRGTGSNTPLTGTGSDTPLTDKDDRLPNSSSGGGTGSNTPLTGKDDRLPNSSSGGGTGSNTPLGYKGPRSDTPLGYKGPRSDTPLGYQEDDTKDSAAKWGSKKRN